MRVFSGHILAIYGRPQALNFYHPTKRGCRWRKAGQHREDELEADSGTEPNDLM